MYVAKPGNVLVACDLSQAESWIVAYLSNDPTMKDALAKGIIHETTASRLYQKPIDQVTKVERYAGKQCNHAFAYRMEAKKHMVTVNAYSTEPPYITITLPESVQRYTVWHSTYPNVKSKWWPQIDYAILNTRRLTTPYGRVRNFYGGLRDGYERTETIKEATAYIPQSTIADHVFGAVQEGGIEGGIKEIHKRIVEKGLGKIINTSHDSVCVECIYPNQQDVASLMKSSMMRPLIINGEQFVIPADLEVGDNYGEMTKFKIV